MEKVLALHEVELFDNISTEELSVLAAIAEEDQFDAGSKVIAENEPADSLNLILSGKVRVMRGEQEIFVAGPNDTLGALSLLDGEPWLFSAEVIELTQVLRIDRETFLDVASDHPGIIEGILRSLSSRIRRLVEGAQTPSRPKDAS
jgi:CRP/FNR family cyclic AMP-dependent transcriptional regulator